MAKRISRKIKNKKIIEQLKIQRGIERALFLKENGDMKQWNPPRIVITDKKKRRNKKACRGKWNG
jgi:hypothetical protein